MFDKNNDESISKGELCKLIETVGINPTDSELEALIADVDENG